MKKDELLACSDCDQEYTREEMNFARYEQGCLICFDCSENREMEED